MTIAAPSRAGSLPQGWCSPQNQCGSEPAREGVRIVNH
ncbi:hypothetical protein PG5_24810 [Pseudomonas sp. G5(2012)]|nr:hypothetical protein PG5_24810 [Pseudomonas sp. G5(2012)]